MLCPICFGHRLFFFQGHLLPCPECEGFGEIHCCDGLQAQPFEEELLPFRTEEARELETAAAG
jgi:hypothetical protein